MNKAGDRATGLEREMPFAAAYISVMASGGIAHTPALSVFQMWI